MMLKRNDMGGIGDLNLMEKEWFLLKSIVALAIHAASVRWLLPA